MTDCKNNDNDLWVFGYGSLMWRPGFTHAEFQQAEAPGFAREFCLSSTHYRGTEDNPGLVLGLVADSLARTNGIAFRVSQHEASKAIDYLRERELITYAYVEQYIKVTLTASGQSVQALTYVMDQTHVQYAGRMPELSLIHI